jgi:hypothetical protein
MPKLYIKIDFKSRANFKKTGKNFEYILMRLRQSRNLRGGRAIAGNISRGFSRL